MSESISRSGAGRRLRARFALFLVVFGPLAFTGICDAQGYSRGGISYEKRLGITVTNPLHVDRTDERVVIDIGEVIARAPDFPGGSFVVVDPGAEPHSPCHIELNGNDTPSQLDDLDGDGGADELVFLASVRAGETKTYYLYYTVRPLPAPAYPKRTQITSFEVDPNTLLAIESDTFMFRFCRVSADASGFVGDMFGKYREYPGYTQHLYDPGFPSCRWAPRAGECMIAARETF